MAEQMKMSAEMKVAMPIVDALVFRALSVVATRSSKPSPGICEDVLNRLYYASADLSANKVERVIKDILRSGVSAEMISDVYIPLVARKMGEEWANDEMNFASVTIGTARLQSAIRFLSTCWAVAVPYDCETEMQSVAVIVAQDTFHTLGAVILCGQLRRMGISVKLMMGASREEILSVFKGSHYAAALISSSGSEPPETLANIVKNIRCSAPVCPPIVIGGNIVNLGVDIKALTGADFVTSDPDAALDYCGLKINQAVSRLLPMRRS